MSPARPAERHHSAKLDSVKVKEMRERYALEGVSMLDLACEYGVGENACRSALIGETWKGAGGPLHSPASRVTVPGTGTFLVVDGKVRRAAVDTQGYAGPQMHLIVTEEPWE